MSSQISVHRQDRNNNTMNKAESISLSKVKRVIEIQPQELCLFQAGNAYGKWNQTSTEEKSVVPLAIPETMLLLSSDDTPHTLPWERTNGLFSLPFCTSALSQRRSLIFLSVSSKLKILIRVYTSSATV